MARIGRPKGSKKYTAAGFRKACNGYFNSISYETTVMRQKADLDDAGYPQLDAFGHIKYKHEPIVTADGNEAKELRWIEPPSIQGLCLYLGIDAATFWRYTNDEEDLSLAKEAKLAKARVEAYLISRLEDKSAANGTKFNLQHNFGWMDRKTEDKTELGAGGYPASDRLNGMTMEEKIKMLREAGVDTSLWEG